MVVVGDELVSAVHWAVLILIFAVNLVLSLRISALLKQ